MNKSIAISLFTFMLIACARNEVAAQVIKDVKIETYKSAILYQNGINYDEKFVPSNVQFFINDSNTVLRYYNPTTKENKTYMIKERLEQNIGLVYNLANGGKLMFGVDGKTLIWQNKKGGDIIEYLVSEAMPEE